MQVILHLGVHCTDEDKLLKTLLRNADAWRHQGVAIPGPSRYRKLLSQTLGALAGSEPTADARDVLLDAILSVDPEHVTRLVLSHPNIFSVPRLTFAGGELYRWAEQRMVTFCDLFDADDVELFIGLRNPATFIPALLSGSPADDLEVLLEGVDPMQMRWSHLIRRIQNTVPEVPITVWANEDTPLIWGEILRRMGGVPLDRKIAGAFDMFSSILSREGMKRFRAFLAENPTITEAQKRSAMLVMLDHFALDEEVEEELDLPGWDAAYVDMLTELYEDDLDDIAEMDDVLMIRP